MRQATNEAEAYKRWRDAAYKGVFAPIQEGDPWLGKFRIRRKDGQSWTPVSIELQQETDPETGELIGDEKIVAIVGFKGNQTQLDPLRGMGQDNDNGKESWTSLWLWCASNPVTDEDYFQAYETGRWPDAAPGEANFKPADEFEALVDQLDAIEASANAFDKIEDKRTADQVANLKDRALDVSNAIEKIRVEKKAPILEEGKRIDATYGEPRDRGKGIVERLRKLLKPWFAKIEAEAEAERQKAIKASQEAAAKAEEAGAEPAYIPPPEPVRARVGGMGGRKTSSRKEMVVTIVDYGKALLALKDDPDVKAAVEKAAKRRARANVETDGVAVSYDTKVV